MLAEQVRQNTSDILAETVPSSTLCQGAVGCGSSEALSQDFKAWSIAGCQLSVGSGVCGRRTDMPAVAQAVLSHTVVRQVSCSAMAEGSA